MSAAGKKAKGRAGEAESSKPQLTLVPAQFPAGVPQYLTIEEVAALLRCQPSTIYQYVHRKKIPFRKRGRKLLFDREEIDQWTKDCAGR